MTFFHLMDNGKFGSSEQGEHSPIFFQKADKAQARGVIANRALCAILAFVLSLSLFAAIPGQSAYAARQTDNDIVGGYSASSRGLTATNLPSITAKSAYVQDSDGNVYFERNADTESHIASITKVMTCIVALENADLDKQIRVSERAAQIGESTANLAKDDVLTLKNALIGLMIPSGNDAACAIAENVGADLVAEAKSQGAQILDAHGNAIDLNGADAGYNAFVAKMNEKAQELGMTNSLFSNPHGLDVDQFKGEELHSSARDVSTMSAYGMENETFREIAQMGDTNIVVKRGDKDIKIKLEGTDELIGTYKGACGIKTGFTQEAGGCFTGAVLRDGTYLYAVVLGSATNEKKFDDTKTIYDWVYDNFIDFPLVETDEYFTDEDSSKSPVIAEVPHADWIDRTIKATVEDPEQKVKVNAIFGNVSQSIHVEDIVGEVKKGDTVGAIEYFQGNNLLASIDLIACEDSPAPSPLDVAVIAVQRLFGSIGGNSDRAEMLVYNRTDPILSKV